MEGSPNNKGEENEKVDLGRRGILKGFLAVGTLAAIGGAGAMLSEHPGEQEGREVLEVSPTPYDVSVEQLSYEEVKREIVFNKGRIVRLGVIESQGFQQVPDDNDPDYALRYFLDPYRASHTIPSHNEIQAEIDKLQQRIKELVYRRDKKEM
jgi:hypothetical protein